MFTINIFLHAENGNCDVTWSRMMRTVRQNLPHNMCNILPSVSSLKSN
jgi:hypothetical protein